jgi:hypothetical protein
MVDPLTIAAGASAVGGLMGYKGNKASQKQAESVGEYNAALADNEAVLLARQSRDRQASLRQQSDFVIGTQRVMTAASGVQMTGSPLNVVANTYFNTEVDAQKIMSAGDMAQMNKQAEAALAKATAGAQAASFKQAAYGSLISGAGGLSQIRSQQSMLGLQRDYYKQKLGA